MVIESKRLALVLGLIVALTATACGGSSGGAADTGSDPAAAEGAAGEGASGDPEPSDPTGSGSSSGDEGDPSSGGGDSSSEPDSSDPGTGSGGDMGSGEGGDGEEPAADEPQEPVANADGSDGCEPGELLDDSDNCVPACSLVSCGNGTCELDAENQVFCECDEGYDGDACDVCAAEYEQDAAGACVTACSLVECGAGRCFMDSGVAKCSCRLGYTGDACDECAPGYDWSIVALPEPSTCELSAPSSPNMKLWLDADDEDSLTFYMTSDDLMGWASLAGSLEFTAPASANRPLHGLVEAGDTRPGVIFDGVDDALEETFNLGGSSYSIFIVTEVAELGYDQTILSAVSGGNFGLWLRAGDDGQTLKMRHKNPNDAASDNVTLSGLDLTTRTVIEVHRAGLGLQVQAEGSSESVLLSTEPLTTLDFVLGRRADSGTMAMDGVIYEVMVVAPAVASSSREDYRAYLKAKWDAK